MDHMHRVEQWLRVVALLMAVVMFVTSLPLGVAQAGLITTDELLAEAAPQDRERVTAFLERQDVRQQMVALGVDPNEALARVASLSDEEVRQISGHLDNLPAGQSAFGTVLGAMLIIFLVLLVTDLLGLTNVFPFVRR
jgi:hypothetical protein